ncbi:MAG: hypothetical protein V3T83_12885, partial [Acidobacteriota bacterium]
FFDRPLEQKFGALPEKRLQQVAAADADTLLAWAGQVLTSESLDQVFKRSLLARVMASGVGAKPIKKCRNCTFA